MFSLLSNQCHLIVCASVLIVKTFKSYIQIFTPIRFSTQACRFMDAYHRGLNGKQAAWASKKYRGH
ncbi:uncharacterized protein F5147DRAFT_576879 [Suillus discolor]|uniref:Uncharacterized protein n=1 Tax=Suillus discolor TaxID=1912936 RepID=A0A9P7JU75_9AGAM|nr:uncharacterized protein F5147DRAFT_576879 [Suillus discolor]KAG2108472.1 hypothetical protein F5147DRAFT_576879 [Suillus discolor]